MDDYEMARPASIDSDGKRTVEIKVCLSPAMFKHLCRLSSFHGWSNPEWVRNKIMIDALGYFGRDDGSYAVEDEIGTDEIVRQRAQP